MAVYHYTRATRAALLDQVLARVPGLTPQNTRMAGTPTDVWLTVPDAIPEPLVAAVVAAHDATALDAAVTQQQAQDDDDRTTTQGAVAALLTDATALADATQLLTTAQTRAMLERTDRALAVTLRLLLRLAAR